MSQFDPSPVPPATPLGPTTKTNGLSIISLITGILGVIFLCLNFLVPFLVACGGPLSLAAVITGLIGLNQIKKTGNQEKGKGLAIAGVIQGAVGIIVDLIYTVLILLVIFGALSIPFISNSVPVY
jgi:hypothetical protein